MATLKDVQKLAKTGFVSIARLESELGLPRDKACRALLLCWQKGLLNPVVEAYFAEPVDGMPAQMKAVTYSSRETWYVEELDQLRSVFNETVDGLPVKVGVTVNDLKDILEIDGRANPLRQALKVLVDSGEIMAFTATAGGAYGRRPIIYGNDMGAIKARNRDLAAEVVEKKASRKKDQLPPVPS